MWVEKRIYTENIYTINYGLLKRGNSTKLRKNTWLRGNDAQLRKMIRLSALYSINEFIDIKKLSLRLEFWLN